MLPATLILVFVLNGEPRTKTFPSTYMECVLGSDAQVKAQEYLSENPKATWDGHWKCRIDSRGGKDT